MFEAAKHCRHHKQVEHGSWILSSNHWYCLVRIVEKLAKSMNFEFENLPRVLLWSLYFLKHPPEVNASKEFPHRKMHTTKGTFSSNKIIEGLGEDGTFLQRVTEDFKDSCLLHMSVLSLEKLFRRGVMWIEKLTKPFFESNLVVSADKDGSHVVMSIPCYLG